MKAFFEEYGMVLVVTILAIGMITFSFTFRDTMSENINDQWNQMLNQGSTS